MEKLRSLTVAAAVAVALAACASNDTMPEDTAGRTESSSTSESTAGAMPDPATGAATGASAAAPIAVGLQVETPTGEPLGTVIEIVADAATGEPLFAVIHAGADTTAVPYAAAASMVQGDALIVDQARLAAAPHVEQGETRAAGDWTTESSQYWGEGGMRTASPETGTDSSSSEPTMEEKPRG